MHFQALLEVLLDRVRDRIRNGEITERGLARATGLSQSHIHNVLSGTRCLTPRTADVILAALGLSLTEVLKHATEAVRKPAASQQHSGRWPELRKQSAAS